MTVPDDARPTGAIAVRLSEHEAAALVEAAALAATRLLAAARPGHLDDDLAAEARALAAAVRKLDSLGAPAGGLEIHARRSPIFERHD
ncbi:hypothetical protein [Actinomadura nitritigenes]|uniref:hypothetical protein n=1 Tax=Actinomadura nitritigenes TaxID=134602 RepID=UPI003D8AD54C